MTPRKLTLILPVSVSDDEARLLLAIKLYEVGRVSLGQAAQMAGFSRRAFIEVLARHKVPVFNYSEIDFEQELRP